MIGYVQAKARRYMGMGTDRYRRADHFHLPPADLSLVDHLAITSGMGQLATDCGGSASDPIIGLTVEQMHRLLDTLHFRVVSHRLCTGRRGVVDEYRAEHLVTGKPLIVYAAAPITSDSSSEELSVEGLG